MHPENTALKAQAQEETVNYAKMLEESLERLTENLRRQTNTAILRDYEELKSDTTKGMKSAKDMRERQLRDFAGKDMDDLIEHTYNESLKRLRQELHSFCIKFHLPIPGEPAI